MNRTERNALVVENLPLVGYLVSDLCARATHLSRDDMASAGSIALITAAEAFKPELGIPFGAYARKRIIGAFADEMRAEDWATRSARKRIKETLAVQETLTAALGRTPSVDEIANALGVERSIATDALADAARTLTTLDETTSEFLASTTPLPEETLLEGEQLRYLRTAVTALPEKMRYVIEQIYFEDRSVKEIAEELGTTHSAVSQQRSEAIRLLRDGLGTHYADVPEADYAPQSRISPVSREAYLARVAEQAAAGLSRMARPAMAQAPRVGVAVGRAG
ncbi:sigma-70 family RNA polymerase sigma factor [Microbacterium sp. STN6]|uniref:sigma-70 family RNA polymerase sigma factor n=1 Tax=Microbacterium sp. STN6 TaxID=2995588 RepID=UPI002260B900|nr:sigma-70 family RNA polymerase sigma factor [Microbacterium sp. STN6]MCX7522371.1 sigma-70 family RNA polymerase sigma factor [Microbacterium sp. STN6]